MVSYIQLQIFKERSSTDNSLLKMQSYLVGESTSLQSILKIRLDLAYTVKFVKHALICMQTSQITILRYINPNPNSETLIIRINRPLKDSFRKLD